MQKKYIPNCLSIFRFFLVAVFTFFIFYEYPDYCLVAAGVYLLAGLTDILDGWLARRNGWFTKAGRILDPLADKLLQLTALICLGIKELLPFWLIIPFILKELIQLTLGFLMIKKRSVVVKSLWYGKTVTVMMCVAAVVVLATAGIANELRMFIDILYIIILAFTIISTILYICKYINVQSEEDVTGKKEIK